MSKKEIQFSLKLNIDGKEQFVNVTSSVRQMQKALSNARTASEGVMGAFMRFNQATQAFAAMPYKAFALIAMPIALPWLKLTPWRASKVRTLRN